MCHGSLTAGLVGLKNPQYDLWGNTVDVACQMESIQWSVESYSSEFSFNTMLQFILSWCVLLSNIMFNIITNFSLVNKK